MYIMLYFSIFIIICIVWRNEIHFSCEYILLHPTSGYFECNFSSWINNIICYNSLTNPKYILSEKRFSSAYNNIYFHKYTHRKKKEIANPSKMHDVV